MIEGKYVCILLLSKLRWRCIGKPYRVVYGLLGEAAVLYMPINHAPCAVFHVGN